MSKNLENCLKVDRRFFGDEKVKNTCFFEFFGIGNKLPPKRPNIEKSQIFTKYETKSDG